MSFISDLFGGGSAGRDAANAANRETQFGIDTLMPFLEAGTGQLGALTEGATAGGLDARIAELLGTDTFGALVGERTRAVQGQLSAGGLTRSGTGLESIANIPTELALALESMLTGRSGALAGQGLGAGGGIADLFVQRGQNTASGILADAQSGAAGLGSLFRGLGSIGSAAFDAGGLGELATGIFFSDERLKINVEKIGEIGDLELSEWDWDIKTKDTVIWECPRVGFIAQDVRKKYPEFVGETCGFLFVNYVGLMAKLQANLNEKIALEAEAA